MTTNVGTLDRIARALFGLGLLYVAFFSGLPAFDGGFVKYGAVAVALVMLIVAATRVCPVYLIFGLRTCRA